MCKFICYLFIYLFTILWYCCGLKRIKEKMLNLFLWSKIIKCVWGCCTVKKIIYFTTPCCKMYISYVFCKLLLHYSRHLLLLCCSTGQMLATVLIVDHPNQFRCKYFLTLTCVSVSSITTSNLHLIVVKYFHTEIKNKIKNPSVQTHQRDKPCLPKERFLLSKCFYCCHCTL